MHQRVLNDLSGGQALSSTGDIKTEKETHTTCRRDAGGGGEGEEPVPGVFNKFGR